MTKLRITSDKHNYVVEELVVPNPDHHRTKKDAEPKWQVLSFHMSLEWALKWAHNYALRNNLKELELIETCLDAVSIAMKEAEKSIKDIAGTIEETLRIGAK